MDTLENVIKVKVKKSIHFLKIMDITYIKSYGAYSKICQDQKSYISFCTIRELESEMNSDNFILVHRSYLVNRNMIERIEDGKEIILNTGEQIPLARRRKTVVMNSLSKWLVRRTG